MWLLMLTYTGYKVLGRRYKNSLRLGLVWVEDAAVAVSPEGSLPVDSWCPGATWRSTVDDSTVEVLMWAPL